MYKRLLRDFCSSEVMMVGAMAGGGLCFLIVALGMGLVDLYVFLSGGGGSWRSLFSFALGLAVSGFILDLAARYWRKAQRSEVSDGLRRTRRRCGY